MHRMHQRQRIGYNALTLLLTSVVAATDVSFSQSLQSRADSCPSSNPVSCAAVDSKLPDTFCCSSGTSCVSLDSSSSAICCPNNGDCKQIKPITCDVKLQDPSQNGPVLTTKLQESLEKCADKCCPFGYSCSGPDSNALCVLNLDTAVFKNNTSSVSPTSTTIRTPSSSTTSSSNPTKTSVNSIDSQNPPPNATTNKFPAGVFMAGFFPGIVIGVLATLAWVVLTGRHTKPGNRPATPTSLGMASAPSFHKEQNGAVFGAGSRPWISRPFASAQNNDRSDFLSRTRSRARSIFSLNRGNNSRTVDSVDMWTSKMPTPPAQNNVPADYLSSMNDVPVTPGRRVARYSEEGQSQRETPYEMYQRDGEIERPNSTYASGALPTVAPLRGMQSQRPVSGSSLTRRDSGIGTSVDRSADFSRFGSPFQTPEKKTQITHKPGLTNLKNKTFHDITTLENGSPVDRNDPTNSNNGLAFLVPMTYTPEAAKPAPKPTTAVGISTARPRPPIPVTRPETEIDDSDGISVQFDNPPPANKQPKFVTSSYNPHLLHTHTLQPSSHQVMCDRTEGADEHEHDPRERDPSNKFKHATNATTFTTMLRQAGIPDPGDQVKGKSVPSVPKVPKGYL